MWRCRVKWGSRVDLPLGVWNIARRWCSELCGIVDRPQRMCNFASRFPIWNIVHKPVFSQQIHAYCSTAGDNATNRNRNSNKNYPSPLLAFTCQFENLGSNLRDGVPAGQEIIDLLVQALSLEPLQFFGIARIKVLLNVL